MAIIPSKTSKGEKRYKVRVRDVDGKKWLPQVTCHTKAEAEQVEEELMQGVARKVASMSGNPAILRSGALGIGSMPLREYYSLWAKERRSNVSDGWKSSQDGMFNKYVDPVIGGKCLKDITRQDIGSVMLKAHVEHKKSQQTRQHIYQLMHGIFGEACDYYEVLDFNPVTKDFRVKITQKERNHLLPEQSLRLLESCKNHWTGPAIWLSLLGAMRIGEIQALKVSSIHFDQGYILVRANFDRKMWRIQDYPKGKSWQKTPLSPALAAYLKEKVKGKGPDDFVCHGPDSIMLHYTVFNVTLKRLCKENGLPIVTPHELRHSSTELYVENGASVEDIRRLLHHKSGATTMRYIHRSDERLNGLAEKVGNKISHKLEE